MKKIVLLALSLVKKYGGIALAVALAGVIFFQNRRINQLSDVAQIQAVQLNVLNDSVATYQENNGDLNFKISTAEIEKDNLKQSLEILGYEIKKFKEKDIEWRNIVNSLELQLQSTGSGVIQIKDSTIYITQTDTVYKSSFAWSNDYLSLTGNIDKKLLSFDYGYKTQLNIFQERKRKSTMVTVFLTDPNAFIVSGNSITVKNPNKWWENKFIWGAAGFFGGVLLSK